MNEASIKGASLEEEVIRYYNISKGLIRGYNYNIGDILKGFTEVMG